MSSSLPRVWFISRSYPPTKGGGPFVRKQQVDFLKKNEFNVSVVTLPQAGTVTEPNSHIIRPWINTRLTRVLERLCILPDYLCFWSKQVRDFLAKNASKGDIVFVTSGGELGFFKEVANLKKERADLKVVLNYHDVLDYAFYENERIFNHPHLSIEKLERKAIGAADIVLTQSQIMQEQLKNKYPEMSEKFDYCHFGYDHVSAITPKLHRDPTKPITIGYIGAMGPLQSPQVLIEAYKFLSKEQQAKIDLVYIGDTSKNRAVHNSNDINKVQFIPRDKLISLLSEKIDIAFVSAVDVKPLRALMSTKFYEYIGLGLPILGALPNDCEAERVIKKFSLGWTARFGDNKALASILSDLIEHPTQIDHAYENMAKNRVTFDSNKTMMRMTNALKRLIEL